MATVPRISPIELFNSTGEKLTDEDVYVHVTRAGVKSIELQWNGLLNTDVTICGFESWRVSVIKDAKTGVKQHLMANPQRDGFLTFYPDKLGMSFAWLVDSPYNRRMLAGSRYDKRWTIVDKKIEKEIFALADEMGVKKPEEIQYTAVTREQQLEKENVVLKEELEKRQIREKAGLGVETPQIGSQPISSDDTKELVKSLAASVNALAQQVKAIQEKKQRGSWSRKNGAKRDVPVTSESAKALAQG
jgi:hypothetical protein